MSNSFEFPLPPGEAINPKYIDDELLPNASLLSPNQETIVCLGKIKITDRNNTYEVDHMKKQAYSPYVNEWNIEYFYYDGFGTLRYHRDDGPAIICCDVQTGIISSKQYMKHGKYDMDRRFNLYEYTRIGKRILAIKASQCLKEKTVQYFYKKSITLSPSMNMVKNIDKVLWFDVSYNQDRIEADKPCTINHNKSDTDPFQKQYRWYNKQGQLHRYMQAAMMYRDDGDIVMLPAYMFYKGQNLTEEFKNAGWNVNSPLELREFIWGMVVGSYEEESL